MDLCILHLMAQSTPHSYINTELTNTMLQRFKALTNKPDFKAILKTTCSTKYISSDDMIYFPCSRQPTLASCGIKGLHVGTSKRSDAESSVAPTTYAHVHVEGKIGVGLDASWKNELFHKVSDDMLVGNSAAETCVLTHMTKATNHLVPNLSYSKKPSQPRHRETPPILRNATQADRFVDVTLNLYPVAVFVILRPKEDAIAEIVFCVEIPEKSDFR